MTLRPRGARASFFFLVLVLAGAAVLVRAAAAPAAQAESCLYDAGTKAVTATIAGGSQATLVVSGGQLLFGAVPAPCGAATTTNTDSITITGEAGTNETLTLDHRGGFFGPGAAAESNLPEIEIATALGDATDRVVVYGTEGPDHMAAGQNGFATSGDGDLDITFSPGAFQLEVHLLGGDDYFNGRGESGAGLHFLGPIVLTGGEGNESLLRGSSDPDSIDGGPGNDELRGQEANDVLDGGAGNDVLAGGGEDDTLIGGPGVDTFLGSDGDDSIFAHDDEADFSINGGPGFDTARVDVLDPAPVATEIVIRPSESCDYDGAQPRALADDDADVDGDARHRRRRDLVRRGARAVRRRDDHEHRLDLDRRRRRDERDADPRPAGRLLRPRARRRSRTRPRSRSRPTLGDTNDRVIVYGTEGRDYMAAGQSGMATSTDGDTDVTFSPSLFQLEVHLLGGDDHFDGRGTGGAGLKFLGPIVLDGRRGRRDLLRGSVGDRHHRRRRPARTSSTRRTGTTSSAAGPATTRSRQAAAPTRSTAAPGIDTMNGSDGDDTFHAQDDEADATISGGAGFDTAYIDTGVDPTPITVEHVIGDGAPPPPPATGCTYDPVLKTVKATLAPGDDGDARRRRRRRSGSGRCRWPAAAQPRPTPTRSWSTAPPARSRASRSTSRAGPSPRARRPSPGRPRSRSRSSSATRPISSRSGARRGPTRSRSGRTASRSRPTRTST